VESDGAHCGLLGVRLIRMRPSIRQTTATINGHVNVVVVHRVAVSVSSISIAQNVSTRTGLEIAGQGI
jgi:hypothetical protein